MAITRIDCHKTIAKNSRASKGKDLSITELILEKYELPPIKDLEYLGGAGGFSGAQLWKITTVDFKQYCLRRWPRSHPDRERLDWINLVLIHAVANGCVQVAVPIESRRGQRYVQQSEFLWELAKWMPGVADFSSDPNPERLENAARTLAQFHLASAQVQLDFRKSPNAQSRHESLQQSAALLSSIEQAPGVTEIPSINFLRELVVKKRQMFANQLASQLEPFLNEIFPVQPVIRDVWHDHVLFTGNEVTGVVDFGAMAIDNIALDLSRLLGSLVADQPERWELAIQAYSELRPLQPREIEFAMALDRCSAFLGSLNWLKWILLEGRSFESTDAVEKRIVGLIARLSV